MTDLGWLSIRQVAALVPCCYRHMIRRMQERPETVPPFERDEWSGRYRFRAADVEAWLERRTELRRLMRKPYLKWCEEPKLAVALLAAQRPECEIIGGQ